MSLSCLSYDNDDVLKIGTLTVKNLLTGSITSTDKVSQTLKLYGTADTGTWIDLGYLVTISFWTIDKIRYVEIPTISLELPSNLKLLAISEAFTTSPKITWSSSFKYKVTTPLVFSVNTPVYSLIYVFIDDLIDSAIYFRNANGDNLITPGTYISSAIVLALPVN